MFKFILVLTVGLGLIAVPSQSVAQNAFGRIQIAPSFAPSVETMALPGSLHDTMKAMSRAMKSIDASDASKNSANAENSDLLAALAIHSKKFTPDAIAEMPAANRAAALADYKKQMDQVATTANAMASAFRKGDNAKAASLYDQMNAEKKRGHGDYK